MNVSSSSAKPSIAYFLYIDLNAVTDENKDRGDQTSLNITILKRGKNGDGR